jgi:hypothetical protein
MGNNTNRELSAISRGSGCMSPAISFVLNSDTCMSPRSLSSALIMKSTSGMVSKELERDSSILNWLFCDMLL